MKKRSSVFYINIGLSAVAFLLIVNAFSPTGHNLIKRALAAVGAITGEGTLNYVARFAGAQSTSNFIGDSIIYDNGTSVGIGTTNPAGKLGVAGDINLTTGANRKLRIGSGTNYYYDLQSTGDDFQIIEAGDTNKIRLHIDYPSGSVGIGTTDTTTGGFNNKFVVKQSADAAWRGLAVEGSAAGGNVLSIDYTGSNTFSVGTSYRTTGGAYSNIALVPGGGANVGIGTTGPQEKLHILTGSAYTPTSSLFGGGGNVLSQGAEPAFALSQSINSSGVQTGAETALGGMTFAYISSSDYNNLRIGTQSSGKVIFRSANVDRMGIDTAGNVGIGTIAPGYKLDVQGGSINTSGSYLIAAGSVIDRSGSYIRQFDASGAVAQYLGGTGDPGNYYDNTTHYFRNRGASATYLTINSSGLYANGFVRGQGTGGYLSLCASTGCLTGYPSSQYPVLKTDTSYIYFDIGGVYAGHFSSSRYFTYERFVDWGNENYYVDPAGTSRVNYMNAVSEMYTENGGYTRMNSNQFYCNNGSGCHFNYSGTGVTYLGNGSSNSYVSGNLGVGHHVASVRLDVNGTIKQTRCIGYSSIFATGGEIHCDSDETLKNIFGYYEGGLSELSQIKPIRYSFKSDKSGAQTIGFSAQNVQKVMPDATPKQLSGTLGLNTAAITALTVNAINELNARTSSEIAELRAEIDKLKTEVEILKAGKR